MANISSNAGLHSVIPTRLTRFGHWPSGTEQLNGDPIHVRCLNFRFPAWSRMWRHQISKNSDGSTVERWVSKRDTYWLCLSCCNCVDGLGLLHGARSGGSSAYSTGTRRARHHTILVPLVLVCLCRRSDDEIYSGQLSSPLNVAGGPRLCDGTPGAPRACRVAHLRW
jgi:hypothetical protein